MFESLDPKIRQLVEQRYEELQIHPEAFMQRFDQNGDGILSENERRAALATLSHELLHEKRMSKSLSDTDLKPGMTVKKRYLVISEIGNGAQGIAYAARDITNQEIVVVKQLRLSHMEAWDAFDAFRRESEVLAKLTHSKLPRFIDAFQIEKNGKHYYFSVQSLMPGRNLADRLTSGEFFSEEKLISIADQCLGILDFLHRNQPSILHRDVKPSNLMLDDEGQVYLVDFGAVQYSRNQKTMAVGTAGYMASEQLLGQATPKSDLYSLGATIIRLATRVHPYEMELNQMRLDWRPFASLSPGFSNWIDKLIDPEPEDRFLNAFTARKLLNEKSEIFVRRETKKGRLAMDLTELFDQKPENSDLRIWESVDQFVCTFPRKPRGLGGATNVLGDIMRSIFSVNNHAELSRRGGGFSFDAEGVCRVGVETRGSSHQRQLLKKKMHQIKLAVLDDGYSALIGTYSVTKFDRTSKNEDSALVVGLRPEEGKWVYSRLSLFLHSHRKYII